MVPCSKVCRLLLIFARLFEQSNLKRNELIGIAAGIISGAAYGLNPVFGKPLMEKGVSIPDMLLVRYTLAAVIIAGIAFAHNPSKKNPLLIQWKQLPMLALLGILFTISSITLFAAYARIPSGVTATVLYLYPMLTAIILLFCGVIPKLKTVIAIIAACAGVAILCLPGSSGDIKMVGVLLAIASALAYALYLIFVGRSKAVSDLSVQTITIYALMIGAVFFIVNCLVKGSTLSLCTTAYDWFNLIGLAIFPTAIAMVGLSVATRRIGATRAAVLGVFEPITSIIFGITLFHEPFTYLTALGILFCLTAVVFIKE